MTAAHCFPGGHYLAAEQSTYRSGPSTRDDYAGQTPGPPGATVSSQAMAPIYEIAHMDDLTKAYIAKLLAA